MIEAPSTLDAWLAKIEAVHPVKWDLGLDRVKAVGERLGVLQPAPRTLLVAGTNGKGSTCEYLTAIALAAGLKVGTATSPHFHRINERIRINGEQAEDQTIMNAFAAIEQARAEVTLTHFEFATLASLLIFHEAGVEVAVLEIGLGGRLDAMNIVEPSVSILTSISMDHESWLGTDREAIGREKAGILRPGIPCVLADTAPPQSVLQEAERLAAPIYALGHDFDAVFTDAFAEDVTANTPAATPANKCGKTDACAADVTADALANTPAATPANKRGELSWQSAKGRQQRVAALPSPQLPPESLAAAVQAAALLDIELAPDSLRDLARQTRLTGRNQRIAGSPEVLLDVAHNPAAAARLAGEVSRLAVNGRQVHAVAGIYADKDMAQVLAPLIPLVKTWRFCDLPGTRAASAEMLAEVLSCSYRRQASVCANIARAVSLALEGSQPDDLVLVFGSFETVAGALQTLEGR